MELKPEFLGIASINPFIPNVSSPRGVMLNSHFNSHLPLLNPDSKLIQSGTEYELGKYINDIRVENDCIVKAIIPRYGNSGISEVPQYLLLVEYEENGKIIIDFIDIVTYNTNHTFFGYKLFPTENFSKLSINEKLSKNDILYTTASYKPNGDFAYGLNANVALMSHPAVSEDGYVVSESFCERLKTRSIIKRTINITKEHIPLNLYGKNGSYKFLPDIGENVRQDGLLCCLRQRNDWFNISDLSDRNLSEPDMLFDTTIYVNTNSKVLDIRVTKNSFFKADYGNKITEQLDYYSNLYLLYFKNIISSYEYILNEKKKLYANTSFISTSPRLHRLLVDAKFRIDAEVNNKIKLCYRKIPIEQYKIDIYTTNELKPTLGYKLTDTHAAKGVITKVLPDHEMPVDKNGVRADVISDPMSTISRMNLGRVYEGYLGAALRDTRNRLINILVETHSKPIEQITLTETDITFCYNYLLNFYKLINTDMVTFITSLNKEELIYHIQEVLYKNLHMFFSVDNDIRITKVIENIENSEYRPLNDSVTYIDDLGNTVTTKEPIRICNLYYMLLEKIGNTFMAVSSAKINNFGFPIKGTTLEKYKTQHALTPTKTLGETEVRILTSYMGQKGIAELLDLSLNPTSHKLAVKHLLTKNNPGHEEVVIDRTLYDYGQNKSLLLLRHMLNAFGVDLTYIQEK